MKVKLALLTEQYRIYLQRSFRNLRIERARLDYPEWCLLLVKDS